MRIKWTEKAQRQLDQIFEYIAVDSKLYANRTIKKIIERADSISKHPRIGRSVPEYERSDIREVFVHPYRIIYQLVVKDDEIRILSVIHSARLLPNHIE